MIRRRSFFHLSQILLSSEGARSVVRHVRGVPRLVNSHLFPPAARRSVRLQIKGYRAFFPQLTAWGTV
jgi:hypothetical protein